MKQYQIITALIAGGVAIYVEFRTMQVLALFFDWIDSVPFIALCLLTSVLLIFNIRHYRHHKTSISFLPVLISLTSIVIIIWHSQNRNHLDNSATSFKAVTYQIGSDGGLVLDFKRNGHIKAERRDHWAVTYYWGKYYQKKDTINLNIHLNFKLGRQAILTDSSLRIIGDTIKFQIFKL